MQDPGAQSFEGYKTRLVPRGQSGKEDLNNLIAYLDSRIPHEGVFETKRFELRDLRSALRIAAIEIVEVLDSEICDVADLACNEEHRIEVFTEMIFRERTNDWDAIVKDNSRGYSNEECVDFLKDARVEIAWLKVELGRLKRQTQVAEKQKLQRA